MKLPLAGAFVSVVLIACAAQAPFDPLADYEEVDPATIQDAPAPAITTQASDDPAIARGKYLVELLGCGSCHTDGALVGEARLDRALAGSSIGIAYTNPMAYRYPGIVFPPNLTPDTRTGIGAWSTRDIVEAIRAGDGRHGQGRILVMPWQGYRKLVEEDAMAIARYLQSLTPVAHSVPGNVVPGNATREDFVHFGVYRTR